ncbi:hypothetical protein BKA70DRAFT_1253505 [Coprinopsis sp. MPI-PUGE-AT-0042]|nr:hypothetical protein BKA70DRAFT_1253505 [Coprinopsis sp. MPI-PUGE-AT-0042]
MAATIDPSVITSNVIATKFAYVASATLLFWDMGLTFRQEVSRVWGAKRTLGTTLFFCNRYLPPAIFIFDLYAQFRWNPSMKFCKNYELASTLLDFVAIAIVEAVLVMRTHALYQNVKLLWFLCALAVAATVNMLTCFLMILPKETFVPASTLGLHGCLSGCASPLCKPLLIAFWVPFIVFETTIFLLTAYKSWQAYKVGADRRSSRLIGILFRDGLIYYIVIICVSLFNFFIWVFDPFASYLAVGLLKCLQATICSRLLLNIRGMLEPQGTSFAASTLNHYHSEGFNLSPLPSKSLINSSEKTSSRRQTVQSSLISPGYSSEWSGTTFGGENDTDSVAARRPKVFVRKETVQMRDDW